MDETKFNFSNIARDFLSENTTLEKTYHPSFNQTMKIKFENDDTDLNEHLKPIVDYLLLAMLIIIMFSMGCEITMHQLWGHMKKPVGLCLGIINQFAIKPLAAYALVLAFQVEGLQAIGVLIVACCPGGVLSNTFTGYSEGDLSLSVALTTGTTVIAIGMLPANIWIYCRTFESVNLVIPYQKMALSLLTVTSPIGVGMFIRRTLPLVAKWTTKIGPTLGLLLMVSSLTVEIIAFPTVFMTVSLKLYFIIIMLPILGLVLGFSISAIFCQPLPIRKSVAIECGIQNFPIALAINYMSFTKEEQKEIVLLPWLYGIAMVISCSLFCAISKLWENFKGGKKEEVKVKSYKGDIMT